MPPPDDHAPTLAAALWSDLGGDARAIDAVRFEGPPGILPSVYDVTGFASATVACAATAVAELAAARSGSGAPLPAVTVDRLAASASFRFETLARPAGWTMPPIWDPVAGDYRTADGWIKLHTNYPYHLAAALSVLGAPPDRAAVAAKVATWNADDLETAVVAAGGCAAAMRTPAQWARHPAGEATASERPVVLLPGRDLSDDAAPALAQTSGATAQAQASSTAPLAGIRILDLTRVIAGPVATRYLAAYGADVLRIDPPGFAEVPALLPEVTAGKRCAALDLTRDDDRRRFTGLVAQAHVIFCGLRPDALGKLGFGSEGLHLINPALVVVTHDAYGWSGPWATRRGFDSLVQMSTGIAAAGAAAAGTDAPRPLPCQALDHGTGHLLAAGACRALTRLLRSGQACDVRGSLVGASSVVKSVPAVTPRADVTIESTPRERAATAWGPLDRVPLAGRIAGCTPQWTIDAGPLGRDAPQFSTT